MYTNSDKKALLRQYETFCFQISYYLLNNEELALKAVTQALVHIYQQDEFFSMGEEARIACVKKCTIQHSLQVYAQSLEPSECQHVS